MPSRAPASDAGEALPEDPLDPIAEGPTAVAAFAVSGSNKIRTLNDGHWVKCGENVVAQAGELSFLKCSCPQGHSVISIACYSNDNRDIVMAATGFGLPDGGNTGDGWCDFKNLSPSSVTEDFETAVYCVI